MSIPAAWHPDPTGRHQHRYWDGTAWTEHVADNGQVGRDPLPGSEPTSAAGAATADSGGTPADGGATPTAGADGSASSAAPGAGAEGSPPADPEAGAQDPSVPSQPASEQHPVQQEPTTPQQPAAHQQPVQPEASARQQPTAHFSPQQPSGQDPPSAQPPGQGPPPAQQPGGYPAQQPAAAGGQSNGLALAALIFGLLSLAVAWIPFIGLLGVVGGFIALLLGIFGRGRAKKIATGAGMAMTGIIAGIVAILLGVASTVLPILFFQGVVGDFEAVDECIEQTGDEEACLEEHAPWWLQWLDDMEELEN